MYCKTTRNNCDYFYPFLPTITFVIDFTEYKIPPQGYLLDAYEGNRCVAAISYSFYDAVELGQTFMRNFYVSIEYGAAETVTKMAPAAIAPVEVGMTPAIKALFVIACLLVIVVLLIAIVYSVRAGLQQPS